VTYYDVYVGRSDDPNFSWGDKEHEGRPPHRLGPFFPATRGGASYPGGAFGELVDRIDDGRLEGARLDWDAWGAKVTRDEILTFVSEVYASDTTSLDEIRSFVESLDPDETYILVASEL
jgi:hypothetical protein